MKGICCFFSPVKKGVIKMEYASVMYFPYVYLNRDLLPIQFSN